MKSKTMLNHKFVKVLTSLLIYIINCFLIYSVLKMHFNSFELYAVLSVGIVFFVTFVVSFISKTNCIHLFISYIIMIIIIFIHLRFVPQEGLMVQHLLCNCLWFLCLNYSDLLLHL